MSLIATWDQVATYVTQLKGYDYLANPTTWIECFKEVVSDARYVGVENSEGYYLFNTAVDWLNVGKNAVTSLDSGSVSLPEVTSVVTDTATGTAVVTDAALATEATGITITLTPLGVAAAVLASMGIGVASFYEFPEFYCGLLNTMFFTDIFTPENTEPLSWDEIQALLRTEDISVSNPNGTIYTYLPTEWYSRAYEYIAPHINTTLIENTFPTAVINQTTGKVTSHASQTMEANPARYLSKPIFQGFVEEVAHTLETMGVQNVSWPDISDLHEAMSENLDMTDYDIIQYSAKSTARTPGGVSLGSDWGIWGTNFISSDGNVHTTTIEVCAIRYDDDFNNEMDLLYSNRYGNDATEHFVGKAGNRTSSASHISAKINGKLTLVCDQDGFVNRTLTYTGSSGSQSYSLPDTYGNSPYPLLRTTGVAARGLSTDTGTDEHELTDISTFGSYITSFLYTDPVSSEEQEVDEGWRDHIHVVGKAPEQGKTFKQRYADQNSHNTKISQPDKNGNAKQTELTRTSVRMGTDPADQVYNHGINNPDDSDSYQQSQDSAQNGKDTPRDNPIDRFNDSVDNNKKSYNQSDVSPETAPDPAPPGYPLPEYPTDPPADPSGENDDPTDPSVLPGIEASGMVSVYNPTKTEVISFSSWLWTGNVFENIKKLLQDPMEAIIGMHIMYATPHTTTPSNIIVGWVDSGVSAKVVDQQYTQLDCGNVTIPEYYGDVLDYEPYVQVHLYLPFVGIVSLKPNDVIGKSVNVTYGIDALTGTCLAMITTTKGNSKIQCYTFPGNCAVQIPLTGGSYAQVIRGIASMAAGVAGSVATGNALGAVGGVIGGIMASHLDVSHSGTLGANAGAMGVKKPYMIITRKVAYDADAYNQFYGYPANKTVTLGSCKGYTRVKSVHIESIPIATSDEKQMIETLLKQGVIIR